MRPVDWWLIGLAAFLFLMSGVSLMVLLKRDKFHCPKRADRIHCNCWLEGASCCGCGRQ